MFAIVTYFSKPKLYLNNLNSNMYIHFYKSLTDSKPQSLILTPNQQ